MEILPSTTVADVTGGFLDVVADNIAVVLGVLAFAWGINFVLARFRRSTHGKV